LNSVTVLPQAPAELLQTKDTDDLEEGRRSTLEVRLALVGAPNCLCHRLSSDPIPLLTPDVTPPSQQVAILSLSKRFLSTPLLQRAIALVHSGQILFASSATNSTTQQRAILPDLYASRTVRDRAGRSVWRFDARRARETGGRLGTDRLRVPKWREVIELVKCVPLARD
jgi:hypothetical protein